jgi:outer membrane protein
MKKRIGIALLLLSMQGVAVGYTEEIKIAFVDAQKVLNSAKEGERLKQVLDDFVKARQSVIDLEEQELKRSQDELEKLKTLLTQEAITAKQIDIEKAIDRYREKVSMLQGEVRDKRMTALSEFNQKLEQVVKQISEKEGYGLVMDRNPDRGAVLYAKESFDITAKVTEQMNQLFSKPKAAPEKTTPEKN